MCISLELEPPSALNSLSLAAPAFKSCSQLFSDLLVFPYLDCIFTNNSRTLRNVVAEGSARFTTLMLVSGSLSRKVIDFTITLRATPVDSNVSDVVRFLKSLALSYANEARSGIEDNSKFFESLLTIIDDINARITSVSDSLTSFTSKLMLEQCLTQTALHDTLKVLFALSDCPEESDIQTSALLFLPLTDVQGICRQAEDFKLYHVRVQKIVQQFTHLRTTISALSFTLLSLRSDISQASNTSNSLLCVWDDVAHRLSDIEDVDDKMSMDLISASWENSIADTVAFLGALNGPKNSPSATTTTFRAQMSAFMLLPKVPLTPSEIRLHKAAFDAGGCDHDKDETSIKHPDAIASSNANDDSLIIEQVVGPPSDTAQRLEDLTAGTNQIIADFDVLLGKPHVDQLSCDDPRTGGKTSIFNMVTYYREEYVKLQHESVPLARDLQSYSLMQKVLIPNVSANSKSAGPGSMTMEEFLDMNKPLTKTYLEQAETLSLKTIKLKNDWNGAILGVLKAINECDGTIRDLENTIQNLKKEQQNELLHGILWGLGAFLSFTLSAFIPGGILVSLGLDGYLGGRSVRDIVKSGKTKEVIDSALKGIEVAKETKEQLQDFLPTMQLIRTLLSNVSSLWDDIATALTNTLTFYTILSGPTGPQLWNNLKSKIIGQWSKVQEAALAYIKVAQNA